MLMFQSTRPVRGATAIRDDEYYPIIVSIHAPRAGRDLKSEHMGIRFDVSIHAPRAGRDRERNPIGCDGVVSIHAPRAGRD